MTNEVKLICVQTCQGMDVAQIYKSKLEAMEIPVLLEYDSASLVFGITVDGLGAVRIMVPEAYAAEAKALLADYAAGEEPETDQASDLQDQERT